MQPPQPQVPTIQVQTPAPRVSITTAGPDGKPQTLTLPRTTAEMRELLAQQRELGEQLTSVSSRRRSLAAEVRTSGDGAGRAGLEDRLRLLDQRILQLETDLALTGRQIAAAPRELIAATQSVYQSGGGDDFEEGLMIGGSSVLFLSAILFLLARRRWKRRTAALPGQFGAEAAHRLERLEHGMEAIAIEIERVSEGQRFVTKLLSESQPPLGAQHRIAQPAGSERSGNS
jgi:hypothetical protein